MPQNPHSSRVVDTVEDSLRRHSLYRANETLLAALSGGPDSVALLLALHELSGRPDAAFRPAAAHLDHGLRGQEGRADRRFCRQLAERLGLEFYSDRKDVKEAANRQGRSLEDAGRRCRYTFLADAAERAGAAFIATGHHRDDLAETVLMRLIRGCGVRGLGAFSERDPLPLPNDRGLDVLRPLLHCRREHLLSFLLARDQSYRTDRTNADTQVLRNRIRHELLPHLHENYRQFSVGSLAALAESARETSDLVESLADRRWNEVVEESGTDELALDAAGLMETQAATAKELLRRAISTVSSSPGPVDLSANHLRDAYAVLKGPVGGQTSLPEDISARREHGLLYFSRGEPGQTLPARELELEEPLEMPEAGLTLHSHLREGNGAGDIDPDRMRRNGHAFLSAEELGFPLTVRGRRPGDRFRPLGAPGHTTLKDFLIDRGVPRHRRDALPVVTTGSGNIAWIAGVEIAHPFRLRGGEKRVLHLWLEQHGG